MDPPDADRTSSFWISSTVRLGGRYTGAGLPLLLSVESSSFEGDPYEELHSVLGRVPETVLVVSAMCNSPSDHRVLAEVSAYLAEQLPALIALESYDPMPHPCVHAGHSALLAQRTSIPHEYRLVDHRVLRSWLGHHSFSLVK